MYISVYMTIFINMDISGPDRVRGVSPGPDRNMDR
jgi:hypothetical protein